MLVDRAGRRATHDLLARLRLVDDEVGVPQLRLLVEVAALERREVPVDHAAIAATRHLLILTRAVRRPVSGPVQ